MKDKYQSFKCLLEYFVAHLEYLQNDVKDTDGYKKYIAPIVNDDNFRKTGQGYNGDEIQKQISNWEEYEYGTICINVQYHSECGYSSKRCYLNWKHTGLNVCAKWNTSKTKIISLGLTEYRYWLKTPDHIDSKEFSVLDLGLNDGKSPNKTLKEMFDFYEKIQINKKSYDVAKEYIENKILELEKNIILHGAPGTGKTFTAQQIASQMIFNKGYENLTEVEETQIKFVQFHPSYDYTDFVEGLRPKKEAGQKEIGFERKNGVFKEFCEKAILAKNEAESLQNEKKEAPKFVFIIDEINRGDISKIFGELFFSIEPSYRGENGKVLTQYQNLMEEDDVFKDGFYIPENVYIIGTMNDIDRSVESMDFAMRRRFVFYEITAKDSAKAMGIDYDKSPMKRLNDAIEKEFGRDYQIGGAYFKKYKDRLNDKEVLKELWKHSLKGLIREYLRGRKNVETELIEFENIFYGNDKNSGQ